MTLLFMAKCPFCGSNLIDEQNTINGYLCQSCNLEFDEDHMIFVRFLECE